MSKDRFNEIRKKVNNEGYVYTKISKTKRLTLKDLFKRINDLDPTKKLDNETRKMYFDIVHNNFNTLIHIVEKKKLTYLEKTCLILSVM